MIFSKTWQQVLDGTKTQTRRLAKAGDRYNNVHRWVEQANGRLRWHVGFTYAIQPGRGKKSVGRIRLTGIRRERVQDITEADAKAEGVEAWHPCAKWAHLMRPEGSYRNGFHELWDSIHRKGNRWADNPEVWVLEFELAPPRRAAGGGGGEE